MKSAASDKSGAWIPMGSLTVGLLVFLFAIASARAQSFTVEWFTLDSGGSVSTGGVYSASVSIGQPVSGDLTAGSFSALSDFWAVAGTIQRLNAPQLLVTNAAGVITLSWEKLASGFVLDSAPTK